jgi:hypothetical protein
MTNRITSARPLTTHAERVAVSRLLPPPTTLDMLQQTRRVWAEAIQDGGAAAAERRGIPACMRSEAPLTLFQALTMARVDLRDGWLEREVGYRQATEALRLIVQVGMLPTNFAEPVERGLAALDAAVEAAEREERRQALRERAARVHRDVVSRMDARTAEHLGLRAVAS